MFGGSTSTEYEDIVNKTTDENLTSENWELILNLCDKVQDEGQPGAHAAIAAILKRLAHRNPNVQLYALSLAEALSKNLGIEIHRELASRAFTQGIEKLITDRNTHEKVRRRALGLVAAWTVEFEKDTSLGIMEDCYNNLKAKNYKFEQPEEPAPPTVDDEIRRKEEEELQRVLEMSMQDRGGRPQWTAYSLANGSSSPGSTAAATGSSAAAPVSGVGLGRSGSSTAAAASSSSSSHPFAQPKYQAGGYVPARTPSPATVAAQQRRQQQEYEQAQALQRQQQQQQLQSTTTISSASTNTAAASTAASTSSSASAMASGAIVTRVRALHTFEPTEPGELAFEQGDIIKVVDRGYKDWWRGQLKGRTGIFPVNYVEPMPEPTAAELAREAEQEAAVFAQAVNVEKLLNMLRALDPAKDSLADNEEIQELYRSSMALRPKIVKLIDKYSQKRADLVSMNETFVRARTIFDRMMEESLARHTGVYDQPSYRGVQPQYGPRPDSGGAAGRRPEYGQQPTSYGGWGNASTPYGAYPPTQAHGAGAYGMVPVPQPAPGSEVRGASPYPAQGYVDPAVAVAYAQPQQVHAGYGVVPQGGYAGQQPGVPYTQQGPVPYPAQQQQQQQQLQQAPQQQQPVQQAPQQQQPVQQAPQQQQHIQQQPQQQLPQQQQQLYQQPAQSQPIQAEPVHHQAQSQLQPQQAQQQPNIQAQAQVQPEFNQGHVAQATSPGTSSVGAAATAPISSPQPQTQSPPQQPISGPPPYVYDPSYTYADPNVQAWAQYYAQGGKDLTGSVYFISIPGLTDAASASTAAASPAVGSQQAQQQPEVHTQGQVQQQQTDQGLYSAQVQAQPQVHQQQPLEGGLAYNDAPAAAVATSSLSSSGPAPGASSPSYQQQEQQYSGPRYQLQDQQPPAQTQAQGQAPAQTQYAPYPATYDNPPKQISPTATTAAPRPTSATGSYHSPTQQTSTPSWVLPKKTPGTTPGPGPVAASSGDAYFPVVNQLKGISLSDSGPAGASGGF